MESLRDIGYDLSAAVADIVDNSIDADAEAVRVDAGHDREGGWIRIADDGLGMTEGQLDEAMRFGSSRSYGDSDLGHFGLGLKTASLSQCRRLTVATRSTARGPIRVRQWDLDRVAELDAWHLERLTPSQCRTVLTDPLADTTGTVVLWEHLDRILGSRRPSGDAAAKRLESAMADISGHLAMVFHRFTSGETAGPPLSIRVGGEPLDPWDPFAISEPLTRQLPTQTLQIATAGSQHGVTVQPYVLPAQHHFSSSEAHERAGGPNRWNRQQGLYIYRRDRLIQSGGWNRLRTLDEHAKLARISVDIPREADAAFRINVSKMSVGLPEDLRPQLRALIAGVVSVAQDAYRRRLTAVGLPTEAELTSQLPTHTPTVGDQWPLISEVLENELHDDPVRLDRILVALANIRPPAGRLERVAASRS